MKKDRIFVCLCFLIELFLNFGILYFSIDKFDELNLMIETNCNKSYIAQIILELHSKIIEGYCNILD
jgi:hypothetical protein